MKAILISAICIVLLSSCGDYMSGMTTGMYGIGGYGVPYYLQPNIAAQNAASQLKNHLSTNINWSAGTYIPSTITSTSSIPVNSGNVTGTSTTSRRICSTCHGGGKCNSCGGSGKRTDNYFGTGRSSTITCGVCGGRGTCIVCGGSGYK